MDKILINLNKDFSFDLINAKGVLVVGQTGTGKSVFLHKVINAVKNCPPQLAQLFLVDLKQTEFCKYQNCENLLKPIAKELDDAVSGLKSIWEEIENRKNLFKQKSVYNIEKYNESCNEVDRLPCVVIVIDEVSEIMRGGETVGANLLERIVAVGRGCGVYVVVATQRCSYGVLYPELKVNFQTRICFKVASKADSLFIVHKVGGEKLKVGECLFFTPNDIKLVDVSL